MTTAADTYTVTVVENCRVSPPAAAVDDTSLLLTFLDIIWLTFHPMTRVLFYNFPCSITNFNTTIIPHLKNSLALALKHFYPLAGNLISPPSISTTNLQLRYVDGDSVSVTFAQCDDGYAFDHLTGNHSRDADIVRVFVPQLPPTSSDGDCVVTPLLAVQVTLFPDHGVCIGFTSSHVAADGSSMFNFIRTWASIAKQLVDNNKKDDELLLEGLPCYDRSLINDPKGLSTMFRTSFENIPPEVLKQMNEKKNQSGSEVKVRAAYIITRSNIEGLKNLVLDKRPGLEHVTSFTVVTAYLWTCIAKTRATIGGQAHNEDELQHFGFPMDCRARLDPPLPATYFGNCLVPSLATMKTTQLIGDDGVAVAAEKIGTAIRTRVKEGVVENADKWIEEFGGTMKGEWTMGIAGSPNLDYYNKIDFGWGKPKKFEFVEEPISLSRCKDSVGDLEIGLIMPQNEMDLFSSIFVKGLVN